MYSELECGICYRAYNAGRRCPRELRCHHSFCESCLVALSRPLGPDAARPGAAAAIVCPLCRHASPIYGQRAVRAELRVDECLLERLLAAGVLDQEEEEGEEEGEEEEEEEEEERGHVRGGCDGSEEATPPETAAGQVDAPAGSDGGRLRRRWSKVWRKICGKSSRRRRGAENCLTNDDMRNLAMMSCYMF